MSRFVIAFALAAILAVSSASAGEFNKKLSIGDKAPAFTGLEGADGKSYSLETFKDKDVIVVVVTCNKCPVAIAYEDRLINFAKKHAGPDSKVGLIAVSVSNAEADNLEKMKERAKEKGFNFPYAIDRSQEIGRKFGASVTPEVFVLNKDRRVVYMGAVDDNNDADQVKTQYLEPAVAAALKGETPAKAETAARGCGVRYEKK